MNEPRDRDRQVLLVPVWLSSIVATAIVLWTGGGVAWLWSVGKDVEVIKVQLQTANELRLAELQTVRAEIADVRRRVDRLEASSDERGK